jgi:hypothetical protein
MQRAHPPPRCRSSSTCLAARDREGSGPSAADGRRRSRCRWRAARLFALIRPNLSAELEPATDAQGTGARRERLVPVESRRLGLLRLLRRQVKCTGNCTPGHGVRRRGLSAHAPASLAGCSRTASVRQACRETAAACGPSRVHAVHADHSEVRHDKARRWHFGCRQGRRGVCHCHPAGRVARAAGRAHSEPGRRRAGGGRSNRRVKLVTNRKLGCCNAAARYSTVQVRRARPALAAAEKRGG